MTTLNPTFQYLDRSIRNFVRMGSGVTDMKVVQADGDGPAPDELYAGVRLLSDERVGEPIEVDRNLGRGKVIDVRLARQATFSIQWYRKGANAAARNFLVWAESSVGSIWSRNAKGELSSDRVTPFVFREYTYREIDEPVAAKEEERVQVDLTVDYWLYARYDVPWAEAVDMTVFSHGRSYQQEIR